VPCEQPISEDAPAFGSARPASATPCLAQRPAIYLVLMDIRYLPLVGLEESDGLQLNFFRVLIEAALNPADIIVN
jgi:hypothetical protein